jgi:cation transport regulator
MPYASNYELPSTIRGRLPTQAQDLFREAFNRAYAAHHGDEAIAIRVAWAAVKRRYVQIGAEWRPRPTA